MSTLAISLICGLVALVGLGISNVTIKPVAQELNPSYGVLWRNVVMSVSFALTVVIGVALGYIDIQLSWYMLLTVGFAILFYIALYFLYASLAMGKIGVVMPIANGNTIITAVLALLVFQQALAWNQWVAIGLIVVGIMMFSFNVNDWKDSALFSKSSGVWQAILVLVMWGVLFGFVTIPATNVGPLVYALIVETTIMICAVIHLLLTGGINWKLSPRLRKYAVAAGLFGFVASIGQNTGMAFGQIGVVSALMGANPLVSTLYARVFFHEKLTRQEMAAMLVTIAGIVLIAF